MIFYELVTGFWHLAPRTPSLVPIPHSAKISKNKNVSTRNLLLLMNKKQPKESDQTIEQQKFEAQIITPQDLLIEYTQ